MQISVQQEEKNDGEKLCWERGSPVRPNEKTNEEKPGKCGPPAPLQPDPPLLIVYPPEHPAGSPHLGPRAELHLICTDPVLVLQTRLSSLGSRSHGCKPHLLLQIISEIMQ